MTLTLRTLLKRMYEETENGVNVFCKPDKNKRSGMPSFNRLQSRNLLPDCEELRHVCSNNTRGGSQQNILDQKRPSYRRSLQQEVQCAPSYLDNYMNACSKWLKEDKYNPGALRRQIIPWLKAYIPVSSQIHLPVAPFASLYEATTSLLEPEQPIQAHAEAVMWLMLYAALGKEFEFLQLDSAFSSFLVQNSLLSRGREVDELLGFLKNADNRGKMAVLFADGGIGKTFLADQIIQKLQKENAVLCYSDLQMLCEEADCLYNKSVSLPDEILFIDNVPFGFEDEPIFRRLLFKGYRIFVTTRWKPQTNNMRFVGFPVSPFSVERLTNYFLSELGDSVPQQRKDQMRSVVMKIAKKIECNTDLFLVFSHLIIHGAFEPEEIWKRLEECKTQNILVKGQPLSKYAYQLFFSRDLAITNDQQILYLCCMAFLPPSGIFLDQLKRLTGEIDAQDVIRQELLDYGILKAKNFYRTGWDVYTGGQFVYSIHDNMRQAVALSFADLMAEESFSGALCDFLSCLEGELRTCIYMCNTTLQEDRNRYLNLLLWQNIARFLVKEACSLLLLVPNKQLVSQLFCTTSDLFYFGSLYNDALEALQCAERTSGCQKEALNRRRWLIASVTGEKCCCDVSKEGDFVWWECLREDSLWQSHDREEEKKRVLDRLGFTELRIQSIAACAVDLREQAEELTRDGWLILRIRKEAGTVKLYLLRSDRVHMRRIDLASDEENLLQLLKSAYILPKISWKTTPQEMIREGPKRGRYDGWGIFRNSDGQLLSYVDIKVLRPDEPGFAQIGFAVTDVSSRSQRLTQFLVNRICLEYPLRGTFFTTHEQNGSMRRAARELGYQECMQKEYNRLVKSVATLRCEKGPLVR